MTKVERQHFNRVITIKQRNTEILDNRVSELLDIIDQYGGRDVYPRFYSSGPEGFVYCTLTPKIPKENIQEFNRDILDILKWENS